MFSFFSDHYQLQLVTNPPKPWQISITLWITKTTYPTSCECGCHIPKITSCFLEMTASLGELDFFLKKKKDNYQVLGDLAVSFVVQYLCDRKMWGLFQVLVGIVCEDEPFHLVTLKFSLAICHQKKKKKKFWVVFLGLLVLY